MIGIGLGLAEAAANLLERDEREAVLGDLVEAGGSAWRGLLDVLGLVVRRQALLWKNWQPWAAAFGLALPGSFLLMGFSVAVSWRFQHSFFSGLLAGQVLLLIAWSWTSGFVVGSLSRRTLWMSVASSCAPCLFCLARFRESPLPGVCLLLFLVPAIAGVYCGLRKIPVKSPLAIVLAAGITIFIPQSTVSWLLIWPAWYMVAMARKTT